MKTTNIWIRFVYSSYVRVPLSTTMSDWLKTHYTEEQTTMGTRGARRTKGTQKTGKKMGTEEKRGNYGNQRNRVMVTQRTSGYLETM